LQDRECLRRPHQEPSGRKAHHSRKHSRAAPGEEAVLILNGSRRRAPWRTGWVRAISARARSGGRLLTTAGCAM
jgi:hypothetical protein